MLSGACGAMVQLIFDELSVLILFGGSCTHRIRALSKVWPEYAVDIEKVETPRLNVELAPPGFTIVITDGNGRKFLAIFCHII